MAITYTADYNPIADDNGTADTDSLTVATNDIVLVLFSIEDNAAAGTLSCAKQAGTATIGTVSNAATTNTGSQSKVAAWWCRVTAGGSLTMRVSRTGSYGRSDICSFVLTGTHATTPVPAGNVFSGIDTNGDTTQSITPTASGSFLVMIAADWNASNSYSAAANCTIAYSRHIAGVYSMCVIMPTTNPRTDGSAFTIGEADTGATNAWIALEVQAASSGSQTLTPGVHTNSQTFHSPTAAPGAVALLPGLHTNSQTFHSPTAAPGAVALLPGLHTNSQTFYAPTISQGDVTLSPGLHTNTQTFYALTVVHKQSLWPSNPTPAVPSFFDDNINQVTLGIRFESAVSGQIAGIRFWKASGSTGSHTVALWTIAGTLLDSKVVSGETASGWQEMLFDSPISITENTAYVAGYLASDNYYAVDSAYFSTTNPSGITTGDLHAFGSGEISGGNGVFSYGSGLIYPESSFNGGNYWVDVLFETGNQILAPALFTNAQAFHSPIVTRFSDITVSWTDPDDPSATGVYVYWDTVSHEPGAIYSDYANQADVPIGTESYTIPNLIYGETYYINFSSHGAGGHDEYESELWGEISLVAGSVELLPGLFTNSQTFHAPTVSPGSVGLSPGLHTNNQTFHSPTVSTGAVELTPGLHTNSQTFHAPTVTVGAVTLSPSLHTNNQSFYAPTVNAGSFTLSPSLHINDQVFYVPAVTLGAVTLFPDVHTNDQVFHAPTVSGGVVTLQPSLHDNAQVFHTPTVSPGSVELLASLHINDQTFHAPTISTDAITLSPSLHGNAQVFHAPTVNVGSIELSPSLHTNDQAFHAPTLTVGPVTLTLGIYVNPQTFHAPTVTPGAVALSPVLHTNAQTFYTPTVYHGGEDQVLLPSVLLNNQIFYNNYIYPLDNTRLFLSLRAFMLAYVDCEVIRAPANRAAMPKNDFIALTPIRQAALETNAHAYTETEETVKRPTQYTIQADFYGARAGDRAQAITTLFRDEIACRALAAFGVDIQPLFTSDPQQMPIVTGEEQYLERWTAQFELQMNPILTLAIETANTLTVGVLNVDRVYPPN